ncbi:hypothetical protein L798_08030 [Zootermopsis nevadensis]|uniref:Uncharacterized protein n=1 Tax=Zootermopsis nevadensis TaxID=136037 RepID=A0A067R329_ZOONE|nr:hypothetical protein L798_08030 [Zootermopsis nevadensis]
MSKISEEDINENRKESSGTRNTPTRLDPACDAARTFLSAAIDMSLQSGAMEFNHKRKSRQLYNHAALSNDRPVVDKDSLGSTLVTQKEKIFNGKSVHLPSLEKIPSPPSRIRSKQKVINNVFTRISDGK